MADPRSSSDNRGSFSGLGVAGTASMGVGAALAAGAASACCVGPVAAPLLVALLGAGGAAWAASLKPYAGWILTASGLLLAYSFWILYHASRTNCEPEEMSEGHWTDRLLRGVVWGAAFLWVVSLGINLFLGEG